MKRRIIALLTTVPLLLALKPVLAQQNGNTLLLDLLNRVQTLEHQVRQLRGEVEVLQYQQQHGGDKALEQRVRALEQKVGITPPQSAAGGSEGEQAPPASNATPPPAGTTGPSSQSPPGAQSETQLPPPPAASPPPQSSLPEPSRDARQDYDKAVSLVRAGNYKQAVGDLHRFINVYPANSLTGNAYYWLGESYYAMRNFDHAEQAFLALGSNYPNSSKIPDALLKLGYIYSERGAKDRARQVLEKLEQSYPNSLAASLGKIRLKQLH